MRPSYVLWALDNETDDTSFERLCVDLLAREGFPKLLPVGRMHDHGRDAEVIAVENTASVTVFFQFSLQKSWKSKLKKELLTLKRYNHLISSYVFVTTQNVTGKYRDQLTATAANDHGWKLTILDREWLRHRLEEPHTDLARKYFGVPPSHAAEWLLSAPKARKVAQKEDRKSAWDASARGDDNLAAIRFRRLLADAPERADAWAGLAWSLYRLFRYDEALAAIAKAVTIEPGQTQWRKTRACILVEHGIKMRSRASLLEGNATLEHIAASSNESVDHYNHGNSLSALGRHDDAVQAYRRALDLDDTPAEVWKNMGSSFHELGNHVSELECFDQALIRNRDLPQALMSKGMCLLIDFQKPGDALPFIERARSIDPAQFRRWPRAWYWLASAYQQNGDNKRALERAQTGILEIPESVELRFLERSVLIQLTRQDRTYLSDAVRSAEFVLAFAPDKYDSWRMLARLHSEFEADGKGWQLLQDWCRRCGLLEVSPLPSLGLPFDVVEGALEAVPEYVAYRRLFPLEYLPGGELHSQHDLISDLIIETNEFKGELAAALAIAFGSAYHEFKSYSGSRDRAIVLKSGTIWSHVLSDLIPRICVNSANRIATVLKQQSEKLNSLTTVALFSRVLFSIETHKVVYFLGMNRQFALSEEHLQQVLSHLKTEQLSGDVFEETFVGVNRVLGLIPEKDDVR